MKTLLALMVALGIILALILTDRDRSLWVLNTAIKSLNSRTIIEDVSYGDQDWQKLDIYPARDKTKPAPVIVFVHGGGWYHGRKDQYFFAADAFLRLGYTVVLPDYTKHPSPEARFPAHLIDGAKAVAWVKNNINQHNGDTENIFISGHSAGAHTAAMLAADEQYLQAEGVSPHELRGFAGIAGPYRFIPDEEASRAVFGPETNYPRMNPLAFINGNEPATLLLHSEQDTSVALRHPHEYAAAMEAVGGDVQKIIYQDLSHEDIVTHLHPWFAGDETVAMEIDRFFKARMQTTGLADVVGN